MDEACDVVALSHSERCHLRHKLAFLHVVRKALGIRILDRRTVDDRYLLGIGNHHALSQMSDDEIRALADRTADDIAEKRDVNLLLRRISEVRAKGWIFNRGNSRWRVDALSMPVHDSGGMVAAALTLLGIQDDFTVLDEVSSDALLRRAVDLWLAADQRETFDRVIEPRLKPETQDEKYREKWRDDVTDIVRNVISQAKDYHVTPEDLRKNIAVTDDRFVRPLLEMVCDIYGFYQTQLRNYPAMDFADLMFYAYQLLTTDSGYLAWLQHRWPYILEDEAQDSSLIQEEVLRMLTAKSGNWVRVGDPNQAINETFTTANPKYLRSFIEKADSNVPMETAGRSQRSVLAQANRLVNYVVTSHPNPECRNGLAPTYVRLTRPDDKQGNPPDDPSRIIYDPVLYSTREEVDVISRLAVKHAQEHPNETIAILAPSNEYGKEFVNRLEDFPIEVVEVLKSTKKARASADVIAAVLDWLSVPLNRKYCLALFQMLYSERRKQIRKKLRIFSKIWNIRKISFIRFPKTTCTNCWKAGDSTN